LSADLQSPYFGLFTQVSSKTCRATLAPL